MLKRANAVMAVPPPNPLEDYLREWGLEMYISKFREHAIDLESLQMLTENDVNELVPVIGHRAKLKSNIKIMKSLTKSKDENFNIGLVPENQLDQTYEQFDFIVALDQDSENIEEVQDTESTQQTQDTESTHQVQDTTIFRDTSCELYKILISCNEGKSLLLKNKDGLLCNADRRRLCNLIIFYELENDPQKKISSARLYALAHEIPKVFLKENSSVYFIPYMSISPMLKVSAKGKLLDVYRQRRRDLIKSGVITEYSKHRLSSATSSESGSPRPSSSNILETLDQLRESPTEDVDDKLLWLSNCCSPWATVEKYWNYTAKQRLTQLTTEITLQEYIQKYKALNQPGGVYLLLDDFKVLHPQYNNNLNENWELIRPSLINYAKKKQDQVLKEILTNTENDDTEEILDVVGFMTLPFLMTPSLIKKDKAKKQWRPSKYEILESFICHLKSATDIEDTILLRKAKLQELGMTLQPFIIVVGPTLKTISARYIVLNNLKYELPSVRKSVDACFKLFFSLNAEYPAESKHVWQFIQRVLYKLTTKYDKIFTTVRTLASDLEIVI